MHALGECWKHGQGFLFPLLPLSPLSFHHVFPVMMFSFVTTPKQHGQAITVWNHEPKPFFPPSTLSISNILSEQWRTNTYILCDYWNIMNPWQCTVVICRGWERGWDGIMNVWKQLPRSNKLWCSENSGMATVHSHLLNTSQINIREDLQGSKHTAMIKSWKH